VFFLNLYTSSEYYDERYNYYLIFRFIYFAVLLKFLLSSNEAMSVAVSILDGFYLIKIYESLSFFSGINLKLLPTVS
jgi:hypothetical protein